MNPGTKMKISSRKFRGFTLIELMVAVAIVGILSALAYPAYTNYIMKSRRTDAKNALLDLAAREERYYSMSNQYSTNPSNLGYGTATTFPVNVQTSNAAYYQLSLNAPVPASAALPTYAASAIPLGNQTNDGCGSYTINQLGVQGNTGNSTSTADCW